MGGQRRAVLTRALAALGALAVVAVVAVLAGSGGDEGSRLVVEPTTNASTGEPELLVSVEGDAGKDPAVAKTPGTVGLICTDRAGKKTVTGQHEWPWTADEGLNLPHVHQPATQQQIAATKRCRLTGTTKPIEGEVRAQSGQT